MPSSVVHAALAILLAIGLLGRFYDRRALMVVLVIILIPEADTAMGWVMAGAHRTVLHTMVIPIIGAPALYWETTRENSWIKSRWGERGVRLAWVGLFVHTFAHIALDWAHLSGINLLWPFLDQFYSLDGEASLSLSEGFVQTFVDVSTDPETGQGMIDVGQGGTRIDTHVSNPAQPSPDPSPEPVDRRFPIAVQGWQLYFVLLGVFGLVAKKLQTPRFQSDDTTES